MPVLPVSPPLAVPQAYVPKEALSDAEAEAEAARVLGQLRLSSGTSTEKFVAAALLAAYQSGRVQGLREGVYKPRMECKDA